MILRDEHGLYLYAAYENMGSLGKGTGFMKEIFKNHQVAENKKNVEVLIAKDVKKGGH